jgi:signal peptidase II
MPARDALRVAFRTSSDPASAATSRDLMAMSAPPKRPHALRWLWLAAGIVVADQLTKAVVVATLREGGGWVVTSFFSLVLTYNTGAAFSFLAGASGWQRWFFAAIACAAALVIVTLLRRGGTPMYCAGLALILGGALGNPSTLVLGNEDFRLTCAVGVPRVQVADSAITTAPDSSSEARRGRRGRGGQGVMQVLLANPRVFCRRRSRDAIVDTSPAGAPSTSAAKSSNKFVSTT